MKHWLLLLICACTPEPPPVPEATTDEASNASDAAYLEPTEILSPPSRGHLHPLALPDSDVAQMNQSGSSVIRLLDLVQDSQFKLPKTNLDPSWSRKTSLPGPWIPVRPGTGWKTQLPKALRQDNKKGVPRNLQLLRMSQPLDYLQTGQSPKSGQKCWQIRNGWVHVYGLDNPATWLEPPTMLRASQALAMDRYNFDSSGMTPADFVKQPVALGNVTRESLLLPSPGEAIFKVQIPQNATLRLGFGIAQIPGITIRAKAKLTLQINQEDVWSQEIRALNEWQNTTISLEKWANQDVVLRWISDPWDDPSGDWLVIAEPEIIAPSIGEEPRRVVILGIDTLRPDYLGIHGMAPSPSPFLDQLATQSILFESAWAPAPRTRPSFRTALTGYWPIAARSAPTMGTIFSEANFTTAGIVANVHLSPGMGFANGYGHWRYAHSGDAEDQVDHALTWLMEHQNEDSFLFLHFMDPHIFYHAPEPWTDQFATRERPSQLPSLFNRPIVKKLDVKDQLTQSAKEYIRARYMGEIAYLDNQISRLVSEIDELSGQTLLVLISDHGEEFWEHQGFEHNHSLYRELTQVMFWIRPPKGRLEEGPYWVPHDVSLADILPTLSDVIGRPISPNATDGVSLYPFLQSSSADRERLQVDLDERPLPMGHLMQDTERWGVVYKRHKYILHRSSGEEELFDLATDPNEQNNLVSTRSDLSKWHEALETATGYPTGSGWHIEFKLQQPITLEFQNPIQAIEIIDPEAQRVRRANQEWGERPPLTPSDVATLTLSANKRTVHISPEISGEGTLALLGNPGVIHVRYTDNQQYEATLQTNQELKPSDKIRLMASPSVVIIAGETESMLPSITADSEESAALKSLGYLE